MCSHKMAATLYDLLKTECETHVKSNLQQFVWYPLLFLYLILTSGAYSISVSVALSNYMNGMQMSIVVLLPASMPGLGAERHCENKLYCQTTQHNATSQRFTVTLITPQSGLSTLIIRQEQKSNWWPKPNHLHKKKILFTIIIMHSM